jgi:predicted RNA binding protein YcfA (HicA-like mRNA interferase family)
MKRRDLLRYLEQHGCECLREGGSHTIYVNRQEQKVSTIPRHREIDEMLARKICKDLGVTISVH